MAAAYIDSDYVDAMIGADVRAKLFDDGSGYVSSILTVQINAASALIKAAALNAGYTLGDSTTNDTIKIATFGQFIGLAYNRKGLIPPEEYRSTIAMAEQIRTGVLPIPGDSPLPRDAVGGVKFSDSDATTGKPALFTRDNLKF